MKKRTIAQNRAIYALMNELKLTNNKEDLAFSVSSGRTTLTSELSFDEAKYLIAYLNERKRVSEIAQKNNLTPDEYKKGEKSRKYLFSLIFRLPSHLKLTYEKQERTRLNYKAINNFIMSNRFKNDKPLNSLKQFEISKINSILEKMVESYDK